MNAISLKDVWLKYRVEFKEDGRVIPEDFWALKEINMDVAKGEAICIIGENGSGKTTLLKIVAGMLKPDRGIAEVNGTVSALMEIGAGFQKDLTGKENVYLTSSFFGLTKEQIDARYSDIVKFASIGRFINAPVRSYSQGMYMRLAFSIAIHVNPDILLIDDIFAVGDIYAQRKCINKMFELKEMGKTIIFVTHDIETAKRFCQRGILLKDGRVIKEGGLKEVISYYLKTVGDKKGIGILQGVHLGLVFNNGRLILNWDDDSITKEWGGHTYLLSGDNRYSSLQADWNLKESMGDRILLEGRFWDLPITQLWDIKLDDIENEVDLKIEMDIKEENCDLKECIMCFLFREDYKYWLNPFNKELFTVVDLSNEFSWKCINSQIPAVNFVGLSAGDKDEPESSLPSVVLEDDAYMLGKLLEVLNTDRVFKARVLQSKIESYGIKKLSIQKGRHILFLVKIKVVPDLSTEEKYRQTAPQTMMPKAISDNNLSLAVDDNNKISIYWKHKKITSSKGFRTGFLYNLKNYYSSEATWKVYRVSDRRLDIIMEWIDPPIRQIWNFELLENSLLSWKVYIEALERVTVKNNEFSVMLSPQYKKWFNSSEEGDITEELNTKDFKNIIMKNDPYGIIGLKGSLSNDLELPFLLLHDTSVLVKFNSLEKKIDRNISILGSSENNEPITNLWFLSVDSQESIVFPKGLYLISNIRILIGEKSQQKRYVDDVTKMQPPFFLKKKSTMNSELVIENEQCKFSFIKGRGRLFFKGKEITKNFGIYTSIYSKEFNSNGQWYASLDAIWEIISFKRKRLLIRGVWPYLPIVQIWEIKPSHNGFIWKVEMEVYASTYIERQQANLMLSDDYRNWSVSQGQSGVFPEEFALLKWDNLYREKGVDRLSINGKSDNNALSNLSFLCLEEGSNFEATVENSNTTFKSRILGFDRIANKDRELLNPGVYGYFHGEINFNER